MAIELGKKARDKVTGCEGVLIGRTSWLTGCDQYAIQPQGLDKDGNVKKVAWFDELRLEVLEDQPRVAVVGNAQVG